MLPFRRRRPALPPRRGGRVGAQARAAVVWGLAFAALAGGYAILGPVADDFRSGLRTMTADCRVARVIDGDTVDLACSDGGTRRARITGYDTPELFSPACPAEAEAAERARRHLQGLVDRSRRSETAFLGRDRYHRELVDMRLDGVRVATAMVEAGHGRRYLGGLRGGWCT